MTATPNIEIVSGPTVAGVRAGDRVVFDPFTQLTVSTSSTKTPVTRALHIRSGGEFTMRRFRYHHGERRFERETNDTRESRGITRWTPISDHELDLDERPWRLQLHASGPLLGTVRRFGDKLLCAPMLLDRVPNRDAQRSRWTWVDQGVARTVELTEARRISSFERGREDDVELDVQTYRERLSGLTLLELVRLVDGKLDAERAAAIALQLVDFADDEYARDNDMQPAAVVGFDGVVRKLPSWERSLRGTRSWWFGWLMRPAPPLSPERDHLEDQLRFARTAHKSDVAELVRNLAPERWERERAFLEEVALLSSE